MLRDGFLFRLDRDLWEDEDGGGKRLLGRNVSQTSE